jgi:hypothetical protein
MLSSKMISSLLVVLSWVVAALAMVALFSVLEETEGMSFVGVLGSIAFFTGPLIVGFGLLQAAASIVTNVSSISNTSVIHNELVK